MKIGVVGPGALGSLFAAFCARAGHEVWLVDNRPERAVRLETQGIILHDSTGRSVRVPIRITADPLTVAPIPLVLLCVKSHAVEEAVRRIIPALESNGLIIAFQNGIAHLPFLSGAEVSCAVGVTAQGAHLLGEGIVCHGGNGATYLGFLSPPVAEEKSRLQQAAQVLTKAGIETVIADDIRASVWNKLIINAGINALTVVEECNNGELLRRPQAKETLLAAVQEAARVARAAGIAIADDHEAMTLAVCAQTAANISSMLQDVRASRRTEVDAINGEIVRLAEHAGIDTPVNKALVAAVKVREAAW